MGRFLPTVNQRLAVSKWDPTTPQTMDLITLLDRRAINRRFQAVWGGPASFTGQVWSNDPEINILYDDNFSPSAEPFESDYPFLAEGVRLLHWFREENPGEDEPWVCRFGGHILFTEDVGDENTGRTTFTAFDPWQMLMRRPVYTVECLDDTCSTWQDWTIAEDALPGPGGVRFLTGESLEDIIRELLRRTIDLDGPVGLDAGAAWGGTAFYNGTVEVLGNLTQDLVFQQGQTVGQAWQQIMDTSQAEIIIRPIYDPTDRPGYVAELDIFAQGDAGDINAAGETVFQWDRSGHDLTRIVRPTDGRERANQVKFYIGGPSAGKKATATNNSAMSIARFGQTWNIETRLPTIDGDSVLLQAQRDLAEREAGWTGWTLSPTPEFTWRPFQDYDLGTYVEIFHSQRLRQEIEEIDPRIRDFTVNLSNEGVETVTELQIWREF